MKLWKSKEKKTQEFHGTGNSASTANTTKSNRVPLQYVGKKELRLK